MSEKEVTYEQALRKGKKKLRASNYRVQKISCCNNCTNSEHPLEEDIRCKLILDREWSFDLVDELGICDKYKKYKNKKS